MQNGSCANRIAHNDNLQDMSPSSHYKQFSYEEIIARDKTTLDITWLKDKSLADLDNLPDPDVLAEEIAENLESALGSFQEVLRRLKAV